MLKIISLILSACVFADINLNLMVDNRSDYPLSLQYRNQHSMCSEIPKIIPSNSQSRLNFCFPSSFWDSGLDARDYLEFASDQTRLIFNAYVDIKNNNSNSTTLRVVNAKMSNVENKITTIPFLDETYTPIFIENATSETVFALQINNAPKKAEHDSSPDLPDSKTTEKTIA
jgi:hypothetical protein